MEDTLTHELVHMYDHCKFNVDWRNLRHHACSEVSERCATLMLLVFLLTLCCGEDPCQQLKWRLPVHA